MKLSKEIIFKNFSPNVILSVPCETARIFIRKPIVYYFKEPEEANIMNIESHKGVVSILHINSAQMIAP